MKRLPVDVQSITKMLTEGYVYVDKTAFAHQLIIGDASNYFLARPRRFGKSLFIDTLAEILKGNKELFKDCAIYQTDYDWPKHHVLNFDLSNIDNGSAEELKAGINALLTKMGKEHGIVIDTPLLKFNTQVLVEELHKKYGKIVILVDEYDHPIIDNFDNPEVAKANRKVTKDFFTSFKSLNKYLEFVLITGISKFSQVSISSGLNNLEDITMDPDYAAVLGYTAEELKGGFGPYTQQMADERHTSSEVVMAEIKEWYNGYRFSEEEVYVYNPFSTLKYLKSRKPQSYWYTSGTPSFFIHEIRQRPALTATLSGVSVSRAQLTNPRNIEDMDLASLMCQMGYLTIQDWRFDNILKTTIYKLDFPNEEVHQAFHQSLIQDLGKLAPEEIANQAAQLRQALTTIDLSAFVQSINIQFAKIPYDAFRDAKEGFYQTMLQLCLELSGIKTYGEIHTNLGRIDLVLQLPQHTYIFELKVDQPTAVALDQIHTRRYQERYLQGGKEIVAVAISFSTETRNIAQWQGGLYTAEGALVRNLSPELKTQDSGNGH